MTPQSSDQDDKKFNVWNDIFFDIVDLHGYFPRQNLYGPVCFKISNKFLLDSSLPNICITKDNPIYWDTSMTAAEKYYSSVKEYESEFEKNMRNKTIHAKMFTIHDTNKKIPFTKYLEEIILDNPLKKIDDVSLFEPAKEALLNAIADAQLNVNLLKIRNCNSCYCESNYLNQVQTDELKKLFVP